MYVSSQRDTCVRYFLQVRQPRPLKFSYTLYTLSRLSCEPVVVAGSEGGSVYEPAVSEAFKCLF